MFHDVSCHISDRVTSLNPRLNFVKCAFIHPNLYFKSEDHFVGVAWQRILPEVTVKSTKHGRVSLTMLEGEG